MRSILFICFLFLSNFIYAQSEAIYRKQLKANPNNIQAYTGLISLAKNKKELTTLKLEAIKKVGYKSIIYTALGNAYIDLKDYNDAVISYRQAVSLNPRSATSYNRLGLALMMIGYYRQAEVAFKAAIALTQNSQAKLIYKTHLAIVFENLGFFEQAKEYLNQIFLINQNYAPAIEVLNRLKSKTPTSFNQ